MALTTYAELQASVADWLHRDDLTSVIPDFISAAEARVNRTLRVRRMLSEMTATITVDDTRPALPTRFLEIKSATVTDSDGRIYTLEPCDFERLQRLRVQDSDTDSRPRFIAVLADSFRFYPEPDATYTVTVTAYVGIPPLSDSNTTNWLLTNYPDAYQYGTMAHAGRYQKDQAQLVSDKAQFEEILAEIQRSENKSYAAPLQTEFPLATTAYDFTTGQ